MGSSEIAQSTTQAPDGSASALELASQAFLHSALQGPIDGVTQLVNHVAGHEVLDDVQLVGAPQQAKFGSAAWLGETVGSGLGMVLPFLLTEAASRGVLSGAGSLAEQVPFGAGLIRPLSMTADDAAAAGSLTRAVRFAAPIGKMTLDGALYGLVMTPSSDPSQGFWQQREKSAATSAITFGAMGLTSSALMSGAEALNIPVADQAFASSLKGTSLRLGTNALAGSVGGLFSAESNSLLSGHGLASGAEVGQSMASFLVTGAALEAAHQGLDYAQSARAAKPLEARTGVPALKPEDALMLDKIQRAQFEYFKQQSDPLTGLTKDRSTDTSPSSIAATGFSLTAYPVAVNHGWVTRDEAADYTSKVLNTLWKAPQGDQTQGTSGTQGLFYHFLDPKTGTRSGQSEVSTIDTALLMGGVLFAKDYFNKDNPTESGIRDLADNIYKRADWNWAMQPDGKLSMGWTPENGVIPAQWEGLNEGPILMLLGMGSPTHPLPASAWDTYMSTAKVGTEYGHQSIQFGPMFGHQYPQIWIDFRGLQDATTRKLGTDYFENARQATLAQHSYAVADPNHWRGYDNLDWGLTASDGPGNVQKTVDGQNRQFMGYSARGFPNAPDDGTIAPTAVGGSLPFAPEIVLPTLRNWLNTRPEIFGPLGFKDAFNPTFDTTRPSGWVDTDTLGIDQGPILLMAENYRNGFIWNIMRSDPYLKSGLARAGFTSRSADQKQMS